MRDLGLRRSLLGIWYGVDMIPLLLAIFRYFRCDLRQDMSDQIIRLRC